MEDDHGRQGYPQAEGEEQGLSMGVWAMDGCKPHSRNSVTSWLHSPSTSFYVGAQSIGRRNPGITTAQIDQVLKDIATALALAR